MPSDLSPVIRDQIYIVIPVFNESPVITSVLQELTRQGWKHIIVVDDGSQDDTWQKIQSPGILALRHKINRGKGAATKTGIEAAKLLGAAIAVTMDGDGQHEAGDIPQIIAPIIHGLADIALGTRLHNPSGMPRHRLWGNHLGNIITKILYGLYVSDSQSGFRAYGQSALAVMNTRSDRYSFDSEVIREINAHHLRYTEIPITVRYTPYSLQKEHGQGIINGMKTFGRMLWNIIS
jgi:glycosyltransferase involved in cell wall biosynthesis